MIILNEIEQIRTILEKDEPSPNYAKGVCRGLETVDEKGIKRMLDYLNTHPVGDGSDILKLLAELRGIPHWDPELGKFVLSDDNEE